jgi:hypothetical protein
MNLRLRLALTACGLAAVASGCTTPGSMFRGQSPESAAVMSPTGFNPHHFGVGDAAHEHFYDAAYGTETFSGGMGPWSPEMGGYGGEVFYTDGSGGGGGWAGRMSPRREQRMIANGILPPPGSPYANGYIPTPRVDPDAHPDHVVNGVNIYDAGLYGRQVSACPPGTPVDACRNGEYDLMPGGCPHCGAEHIRWMPTHYQTYAYHRPRDLQYPSQNSVGGAVVYSYYTLKGPSDFFHDEDGQY